MRKSVAAFLILSLAPGCTASRWTLSDCKGQPITWDLDEQELAEKVGTLSDEKLLDLVSCNMQTSHPPTLGFPDHFVTARSTSMAGLLLKRIETRDEGFVSMGYMELLEDMARKKPDVLSVSQRKSALSKCLVMFPPFTDLHGQIHHYCTSFGGP